MKTFKILKHLRKTMLIFSLDKETYIFERLFTRCRVFSSKIAFTANIHFCVNGRDEKIHNFLSNYQERLPGRLSR